MAPFATDLDHPRNMCLLLNGDVLVAETNGPPRPDDNTGIKGWFFRYLQKRGGGGVPSAKLEQNPQRHPAGSLPQFVAFALLRLLRGIVIRPKSSCWAVNGPAGKCPMLMRSPRHFTFASAHRWPGAT